MNCAPGFFSLPQIISSPLPNREALGYSCPKVLESTDTWDPFTERHLHCIWFDPKLRPRALVSSRGEEVLILHPGDWNHGKGPDFLNAEWAVDGRRYQGDIEIHIRPMDWQHHRHAGDPAYQQVRLHVTYESGELNSDCLPAGCTQIALKDLLDQRAHFFFSNIDLSAYQWNTDADASGLRKWFDDQSDEGCRKWLEAAGRERMRDKAQRMHRLIQAVGPLQALYQNLMRGLGYASNADVTEHLACILPLNQLKEVAGHDPVTAYALLTGCAGLLPQEPQSNAFPDWFPIRTLWDRWWRVQERYTSVQLRAAEWRLDGCRPGNHPARRLWAAAIWFTQVSLWFPSDIESDADWQQRMRLTLQVKSPNGSDEMPVVGKARAATLWNNALVPWRLCLSPPMDADTLLQTLPSEPMNRRTRQAAHRFFGPDRSPRVYQSGLCRQGLLQLAGDYGG
jgi:hypothetical protein